MKNNIIGIWAKEKSQLLLFVDGKVVKLKPSLEAWNKSPTGFSAGYGGSGVAQSAIGILLHVLKDKQIAVRLHNPFMKEFLTNPDYQHNNFQFEVDIKKWVEENG